MWRTAYCFSPDGKTVALADGNAFNIQDVESGRLIHQFAGVTLPYSLAFSPDGKQLVALVPTEIKPSGQVIEDSDNPNSTILKVWDVGSGHQIHSIRQGVRYGSNAVFSPHGKWLAIAAIDRILLWDAKNWKWRKTLRGVSGINGGLYEMAFSHDGTLIAGQSDSEGMEVNQDGVFVWNVSSGKLTNRLVDTGNADNPHGPLAFFADKRNLAVGACIGQLSTTDHSIKYDKSLSDLDCLSVHTGTRFLAILLKYPTGGDAELWDLTRKKMIFRFPGEMAYQAEFSPSGKVLALIRRDDNVDNYPISGYHIEFWHIA